MLPGMYYHVYNHANGDEDIFREPENYRWFLKQYNTYITPVAETYAYCLLPNHFHFLVRIKNADTLLKTFPKFETLEKLETSLLPSKQFSSLFSSYTQGFNKRYNRKGSLFLKNFKRKPIMSDDYFSVLVAYIHLNPVHHKFASNLDDWHWSSYKTVLSEGTTELERVIVLNWFGNAERFVLFHEQYRASKFPEIGIY